MNTNAKRGGGLLGLGQWEQLYTGAQINFGDLPPFLTFNVNNVISPPPPPQTIVWPIKGKWKGLETAVE